MTFYRLHFSRPFRTALERHFFALGSEKPPKMEPKPSQNPVENVSKIDLMLRRLKSESEQTLPHFCSFLPLQAARKSSQNRLRNRFSLRCSQKWYKNRCFPHFQPSWPPNWLQDGRPKLAQNRPKTVKIDYRSVKALMTVRLPKIIHGPPKNSKTSVKKTKHGGNSDAIPTLILHAIHHHPTQFTTGSEVIEQGTEWSSVKSPGGFNRMVPNMY